MALSTQQKAIHVSLPMAGAVTPYLLSEFADKAVVDHLMQKGAIVHPAQVHHWQRPSAVIPLAIGLPLLLVSLFDVVKDPAKQLMLLEFSGPLIVGGGYSVAKHAQAQAAYQAPPPAQPMFQPPAYQPPGAIQTGRRVFYRQAPYMTRGGAPRPTYGNR